MQTSARITVIVFSLIAVIAILALWKRNDRKSAITELESRYEAQLSIEGGEFHLGCSSPLLKELDEFAALVARVGKPTILDLTGAPELVSFAGIERLGSLVSLVAIDCPALVSAEGVAGHPRLSEIVLTDSKNFGDTTEIRDLPSLTTLDFSGCLALADLKLGNLPALENLYLSRCRDLARIDVSAFPGLRQLYVDGCGGLTEITGLASLSHLTDLDLSNATALSGLAGVEGLGKLVVLDIRNVAVEDFSGIAALPELRILRMGGQESIETLEPLSRLSSLRELHLEACPNFRSLAGMPSGLTQYAGFTHCPKLTSLAGIEVATGLEQLDLTGCENLVEISAIGELKELVQLSLVQCRGVTDIGVAAKLPKLVIAMLGGSGVVPASVEPLKSSNRDLILDFAVAE